MEQITILPYLGLQITEEEYRDLPYFSYSTISDYATRGHKALYEKKPFLNKRGPTIGSILDSMISTNNSHPDNIFILENENIPSENLQNIIKYFIENSEKLPDSLWNCTEAQKGTLLAGALNENYGQSWKTDTILTKIIQSCHLYYSTLKNTLNVYKPLIVSQEFYEAAVDAWETLKINPYVLSYFQENEDPNKGDIIKFYDQVKIVHPNLNLKGMLDRVIINYTKNLIIPIDFKTISFDERDFVKTNFISFGYDIQGYVYTELIHSLQRDIPELSNFSIQDFEFIVINTDNLSPLIFTFPKIDPTQPLYFKNSGAIRKTWFDYYKEMIKYDLNEYDPYTLKERELNGIIKIDILTQNLEQC